MRRAAGPGNAVALPPGRLAELRRRFDDTDATESTSDARHRPVVELGLSFGSAATQRPLSRVPAPSHRQQPRSAVAAAAATMAAAPAAAETSATTNVSAAAAGVAIWIDGSDRSSLLYGSSGSSTPLLPSSTSPVQRAQLHHSHSQVSPGSRPTPALGRPKPLSPTAAATGRDSNTTAANDVAGRSVRAKSTSSVASIASAEATFLALARPVSSTAATGDGRPLPAKSSGWCPSGSSSGGGSTSDGLVRARAARIADSIGSGASAANGLVFKASPTSPLQLRPRGTVASTASEAAAAAAAPGRGVSRLPQDRIRSVGGDDDCRQQLGGFRDQWMVSGVPQRHDAVHRPAAAARAAAVSAATRQDMASRTVKRDDAASSVEQPTAAAATAAAAAATAVKKRSQSDRAERPAAGDCSSSSRAEEEGSCCNASARSDGDDSDGIRSESGDKGRRYSQALPAATVHTSIVPSAPPKPPRTFEHDLYVQAKLVNAQQQQPVAATAAAAAATSGSVVGQHMCDDGSGSSSSNSAMRSVTDQQQPAAANAQTHELELHVYETLPALGSSSEAGGDRDDDTGHAMAASDAKPPPLPSRPPPRLLDLSAITAAAPNSAADRNTGKVRSPIVRNAGPKAVGPLKALFHRPWRHRREGSKMKRFASAECLSAERAAPAMLSSKGVVDRWSLLPDDRKDQASMHDTGACSALYASIVLVPEPGSLTRSSSCACVAEAATASAEDAATAEAAADIASPTSGSDLAQQPPVVPAAITDSKEPTRIQTLKRVKIKAKLFQAFSVLDQSSRKIQTASASEAVDATDLSPTDVTKDGSKLLLLQKRLQHCSMVKQNTIYASPSKIRERIYGVYNELFSYALIVGLRSVAAAEVSCDGATAAVTLESQARAAVLQEPYVVYKFPTQVDAESLHVPLFCFPDADYWQERKNLQGSESYSFVLTSADGSRTYGYCKRYMLSSFVDGKETARPEVVCVTSALSAAKFFFEILDEFVQRRKLSEQRAEEFLEAAYGRRLPRPGDSIVIKAVAPLPCSLAVRPWIRRYGQDESDQIEELTFTRSMDSRVEDASCGCLLQLLSSRQILTIFAALLSERKIVLCAERLSTLSRCVTALLSLLYPFSWQHALVPVLPPPLLDVVGSPTPFVVGVLSSCVRQLGSLHMDEVLVVNVDTQKFITAVGDENTILPKKLCKALLTALDMARAEHKYQDLMVSEAFLYFFFESIGSIDEFICITDGRKEFQKNRFLEASKNFASAEFVRWFTETQMFDAYVVERCEGYRSSKTGGYEDRFVSWLQDPMPTAERATTPMKSVFRNLFSKPKAKK